MFEPSTGEVEQSALGSTAAATQQALGGEACAAEFAHDATLRSVSTTLLGNAGVLSCLPHASRTAGHDVISVDPATHTYSMACPNASQGGQHAGSYIHDIHHFKLGGTRSVPAPWHVPPCLGPTMTLRLRV